MFSNARASFALILFSALSFAGCQKASTPASSAAASPSRQVNDRACGQSEARANYLGARVGTLVTLSAQSAEGADENWNPAMDAYLGSTTRVTSLAGVDEYGCPGVRVEADSGAFFWRVRDVQAQGVADQKRCGQGALFPDYLQIAPGKKVRLREHREWFGVSNWVSAMAAFVGNEARVVSLLGVDNQGCPGVSVDLDAGSYFWRVRDLEVIGE